jgi:hypothetical protein
VSSGGALVEVPVVSLVEALGGVVSRLDVLKVDAQGEDANVLTGAEPLLDRFPTATIILELWPGGLCAGGSSAETVLLWLENRGFQVGRLGTKGTVKGSEHVRGFLAGPLERWSSINVVAARSRGLS